MTRAFRIYSLLLAAGAALAVGFSGWSVQAGSGNSHWNAVAALLILGFLSEASYLRLRVGKAETQSSVAFVPFIASYLLLDSGWAATIAGLSMFSVELIVRRKPFFRLTFNVAQMSLSVAFAAYVFRSLGGDHSLSAFHLRPVATAASVVSFFAVNSAAVTMAVVLDLRAKIWSAWKRIAGVSLVYDLFSSSMAPALAYLYVVWQVSGILVLIIPLYFVRHLYQITLQLEQVNRELLELMVKAIEARDPYTSGHSQRVAEIAAALARQLGLGAKQVDQIRTAALLHDVGKIHEEYAPLLRKQGKLDPVEKALMQTHSMRSAELAGTISAFRGVITDAVRHHHENYDGTGYPTGLAGRAIPVGARIIMIADTVDAMTTDRPYRRALSFERVAQELQKYAGTQFDPQLVEAFMASVTIREMVSRRAAAEAAPAAVAGNRELPWRSAVKSLGALRMS